MSSAARIALQHSARLSGVSLTLLTKRENGAPLPEDGVFWLSHTTNFVAAVTAPYQVGIDIEEIIPRSPLLFDKVADRDEWQSTNNLTLNRLVIFFKDL